MKQSMLPLPRAKLGMPHTGLALLILAVYLVTWLYSTQPHDSAAFRSGSQLFAFALGIYLCLTSTFRSDKLGSAARVLVELKAPRALWQSWLHYFLRSQLVTWATVSLIGAAVLAVSDTMADSASALTLYALAMSMATILPLARQGALPGRLAWLIPILLGAYLCLAGQRCYALLNELPLLAKLVFPISAPLLLGFLHRRWKAEPPQPDAPFPSPRQGNLRRASDWYRRFRLLNPDPKKRGANYNIVWVVPYAIVMAAQSGIENLAWGGNIGIMHLLMMMLVLPYLGVSLLCRDLHWRHLLAPGGPAKGWMGWNIIRSTLTVYGTVASAGLLTYIAFAWLIAGVSPIASILGIARFSVLACEAVFLVCLATALRGMRHWWLMIILLYFLIVFAVLGVARVLHLNVGDMMGTWIQAGPAYLGLLVAGSLAAILAANRIWTVKRLLPLAVQGLDEEEMPHRSWMRRIGLFPQ